MSKSKQYDRLRRASATIGRKATREDLMRLRSERRTTHKQRARLKELIAWGNSGSPEAWMIRGALNAL